MKALINLPGTALALALLSTLNIQLSTAFAQGSLTPPGAPAPTMKTLSQVEPRTPISSAPYTISQPGSYYLTTNVTTSVINAIIIAVSGVSLDLNGFTISSTVTNADDGGTAILLNSGLSDITICNGHIRSGVTNNSFGTYVGTGFYNGISYTGNTPVNVLVSHVSVTGCLFDGINLNGGDSTVVESCVVRTVGDAGIIASVVKQSVAMQCDSTAIGANIVSDCQGQSLDGYAIYANDSALNCYGYSGGGGYGISAYTAQNCYGYSGTSYGIAAYTAQNCYGYGASSDGMDAQNAENCFGYANTTGYGLYIYNSASGCFGYSAGYIGMYAYVASVCHGTGPSGTLDSTHNVNSF